VSSVNRQRAAPTETRTMNDQTTPDQRSSRRLAPVIFTTAFLCYLVWVMRSQATPESWLTRNGVVFIAIG
jgi:hypothetical protein